MTKRLKMRGYTPPADLATRRRAEVEALYQAGKKQTEIADILGVTQARVSQIMSDIERRRTNKRSMLRMMRPPEAGVVA
jgi:predicted transcriptional regulator